MRRFESPRDCAELFRQILRSANPSIPQVDFLRTVTKTLLDFSGCDPLEMRLQLGDSSERWQARREPEANRHEIMPLGSGGEPILWFADGSPRERLYALVIRGEIDDSLPHVTRKGSFWTSDADGFLLSYDPEGARGTRRDAVPSRVPTSLAAIPFAAGDQDKGLLLLESQRSHCLTAEVVEFFEMAAEIVGIAVVNRSSQYALRERIKELICLYGIARLRASPGNSVEEVLGVVAALLPPAMQFPDSARGRIVVGERIVETPGYPEDGPSLSSPVVVEGEVRGKIEVAYVASATLPETGVFLKEETSLLNTVAHQVALLIERREAEEEQERLQEQLRHADRLATIGELAAGVAHELNEPLSNILGFAQLAAKVKDLPGQASMDLQKIATASLHAREVVKKLLIFSRQMPARKARVNLNETVQEGLIFLGSRCTKEGIQMVQELDPALPPIVADPAQLQQVLVNLVVNAVQAMPAGGLLTIRTRLRPGGVALVVEDTGVGMADDVVARVFMPFFTTKGVGQGTGLGLAVVHGIVSSHGGRIDVDSTLGRGSRFEVFLPAGDALDQSGGGADVTGR